MSANKDRGTRWETAVLRYLQDGGLWVARKPQLGRYDQGDLDVGPDVVTLQAKDWGDLAGALREGVTGAEIQGDRAGTKWSAAVVKRRGKAVDEGYFVMRMKQARELLWVLVNHEERDS